MTVAVSWWPRSLAWEVSGLNCGYWSRDAEGWFKARLEKIRIAPQSIKLLSHNEWRGNIRFNRDALKLSKNNERLSAQYLNDVKQLDIPLS